VTRNNPTTTDIRNWATYVPDRSIGMHVSQPDAEAFDRWLAAHDREVAAKALRDAASDYFDAHIYPVPPREVRAWLRGRADGIGATS
jgi:hypothetical protein